MPCIIKGYIIIDEIINLAPIIVTLEKYSCLTLMLQKAEIAKNTELQILVWLDYTK